MKTFQIILDNKVIGTERVITMSHKAMKTLATQYLGYPIGITVKSVKAA